MITFKANGVALNVQAASMVMDAQSYYAVLELIVPVYIPTYTKVVMTGASDQNLVVLSCFYQETSFKVTCVSDEQLEMLQLVTEPIQTETTVKSLLSTLGVNAVITEDSTPSWWMLPSLNFKNLLLALNKWSVWSNGGAPRFYLDLEGNVRYLDLKSSYEVSKPVDLLGKVESDYNDVEWMLAIPGNLQMYCSDVDTIEIEEVSMQKGMSWAKVIVNDTTKKGRSLVRRAFMNEFNYHWFSARKISIASIQSIPHHLGQCVSINGICKGVIEALTIPIQLNNESVRLNARVVCPGSLEQK